MLWLRALEPVDAPQHFGFKLGLAIGTVRRLEHDEMDVVFKYNPAGCEYADSKRAGARHNASHSHGSSPGPSSEATDTRGGGGNNNQRLEDVYVREKVRVESADPSLISLYSKLGYLNNILALARRNLEVAMGKELEE